jgi:prevent-host-death family protein
MNTIGIRELARNTSRVIEDVERSKKPALVTRHGRPAVAVVPIDQDELEDWILANAPEFVQGMKEAERELLEGRTFSLDEVMAEIEGDGATKAKAKRRG